MRRRMLPLVILPLLLAACAPIAAPAAAPAPAPAASGPLSVMAAASLKDAFEAMATDFAAAHPGAELAFNFAGSQQLAQQLAEGAPGDVFASANRKQMDNAVNAGRVDADAPQVFARNRLAVVFPADNPAQITSLADLARPGLKLVLADASVPAGQYGLEFLAKASATAEYTDAYSATVLSNVVSYETNVRAVLTKVSLGEADAGIVYVSDVPQGSTDVATLAIPDALNVIAAYPIAVVKDSTQAAMAQAFVDYVLSDAGQATLVRFGFLPAAE